MGGQSGMEMSFMDCTIMHCDEVEIHLNKQNQKSLFHKKTILSIFFACWNLAL